jgi:hypothetical protein
MEVAKRLRVLSTFRKDLVCLLYGLFAEFTVSSDVSHKDTNQDWRKAKMPDLILEDNGLNKERNKCTDQKGKGTQNKQEQ